MNTELFPEQVFDILASNLGVGPFDGGCLTFAKGLYYFHQGGELVYLESACNGGQAEHFGLNLGDEFIDASGIYSSAAEWAKAFTKEHAREIVTVRSGVPDEHDAYDCLWTARQIADTMAACRYLSDSASCILSK